MSGATTMPGATRWSRRRLLLVSLPPCLLVLLAAGAYWWFAGGMQPPEVDTSGREREIAEAIEAARAEVRKQPSSGAAWGRLGLVLLAHDYEAAARICLARAEELDPNEPRWPYLNGRLVQQRDPEAALPSLRRAADLAVNNSAPRLHLAETLAGLGRLDEAESEFRALVEWQPRNPRALLGLARVTYQQGNLDEASSTARRVVERVPKLRSAHVLLAEIHRRRGDSAAEQSELDLLPGLAEMEWSDPFMMEIDEQRVGSQARIERAEAMLRRGQKGEAVAELQAAVHAAPESFQAWLRLGRLFNEVGDRAAAEPPLRKALGLRPEAFDALGELGVSLQGQKKYTDAVDVYHKVLKVNPRHALAHFNLAHCQEKLGDPAAAAKSLKAALESKPEFARAHRQLGRLLADAGDSAAALPHAEAALRLDPQDAAAKELLERVQKKR